MLRYEALCKRLCPRWLFVFAAAVRAAVFRRPYSQPTERLLSDKQQRLAESTEGLHVETTLEEQRKRCVNSLEECHNLDCKLKL